VKRRRPPPSYRTLTLPRIFSLSLPSPSFSPLFFSLVSHTVSLVLQALRKNCPSFPNSIHYSPFLLCQAEPPQDFKQPSVDASEKRETEYKRERERENTFRDFKIPLFCLPLSKCFHRLPGDGSSCINVDSLSFLAINYSNFFQLFLIMFSIKAIDIFTHFFV